MPEALARCEVTVESVEVRTVAGTVPSVRNLSRMPPQLRAHAFPPHNNANPKGRPIGSSATKIVARKESKIATRYVDKVLQEADPEEAGRMLRHAMDKFVPDAGRTDTLISVSLTRDDVLAELRRRGVEAPA